MRKLESKAPLRSGELFFSVLILGFSAVALWQAFEISGFKSLASPGVFPMLAAGTMLISSLFIFVNALSRSRAGRLAEGTRIQVLNWRLVFVVVLVAAYVFVMPWIGFMLSSASFLFVAFVFLWRRSLAISIVLTALTLAAIYLVFRVLFQVVLPRGSLLQGWL